MKMMDLEKLKADILTFGADHVGSVKVADIEFVPSFRELCESNACGMYGKNWMCPPDIGPVDELIKEAQSYETAVVFQTVDSLTDSYSFEEMMEAGDRINRLTRRVRDHVREIEGETPFLCLGAGGCRFCKKCAKLQNRPCAFPNQAMSSLEAYGVNVSTLAPLVGMRYINGANTVTYFGAVFMGKKKNG